MAELFFLDTSAWIAFDEAERGAQAVEIILADAWQGKSEIHGSFVTLTELEYIRTQEGDSQQAAELLAFVKSQPVQWHHSDDHLCSQAAKLKAVHKISLADSFVAATALRLDAILVHKDPEFQSLGAALKQQMLPPKAT